MRRCSCRVVGFGAGGQLQLSRQGRDEGRDRPRPDRDLSGRRVGGDARQEGTQEGRPPGKGLVQVLEQECVLRDLSLASSLSSGRVKALPVEPGYTKMGGEGLYVFPFLSVCLSVRPSRDGILSGGHVRGSLVAPGRFLCDSVLDYQGRTNGDDAKGASTARIDLDGTRA